MEILFKEKSSNSSIESLYVDTGSKDGSKLVKVQNSKKRQRKSVERLQLWFRTVFLPEGYPDTVSNDYLEYQVWDTVQAFASSISGSLATAAVLTGVGVGDAAATPLAATLTWLLRDGAGMVGRITFAAYSGTGLDYDCKKWRLFADVLNDLAMLVELVAAALPKPMFLPLVCLAGVGRSLVGVAGGATKAAVAQHQAKNHNMADLSAKDGSQETLVNLMALIVNLSLLPFITNSSYMTALLFLLLTFLHVYANYRAVASLLLETLNTGRLGVILDTFMSSQGSRVPSIREANNQESLLLWTKQPNIHLGVSLQKIAATDNLKELLDETLAKDRKYVVVQEKECVQVCVTATARSSDMLEAYIESYLALHHRSIDRKDIQKLVERLAQEGWETSRLAVPTQGFSFTTYTSTN